jgi:hypothetical protein
VAVITAARTLPVMELRPGLKDVRRPAELMHAYIVLSLLAGIRTEEARALHWAHIDLDGDPAARPPIPPHVAVWRSVRVHGDTKTERSRRTLGLPAAAVQALHAWSDSQASEPFALGTTGTTPGWYSPPATAPRWTQPTSGKCSNASPPRQASETGGHYASCASKPGTTSRCVEQRRLGNWPVSAVPPRRLRTPQHPPAARLRWGPRLVTAAAPGATAPARTRRPAPAAGRCRCPGCPAGPRRGSGSPRRRG